MTNADVSTFIDTDILSHVFKWTPAAVKRAQRFVSAHGALTISCITRYEVLRGLIAKGLLRQRTLFDEFCEANVVLPLTEDGIRKVAEIDAELSGRGEKIPDAGILIAGTALAQGYAVATNNESHFRRIDGLHIVNWLK